MSIEIIIGDGEKRGNITLELNARKTLDGNVIILDHEEIDIMILKEKKKVLTFPSDIMDDRIYETQDRLFKFLVKKGIIGPETIRSGNIYGSLEGKILINEENQINEVDLTLLNIGKWLEEEKPYEIYRKASREEYEDRLLDPDATESTEYDEVPQEEEKYPNRIRQTNHKY